MDWLLDEAGTAMIYDDDAILLCKSLLFYSRSNTRLFHLFAILYIISQGLSMLFFYLISIEMNQYLPEVVVW